MIIIISTNLYTSHMIAEKKVLKFVRTYLHLVKANILWVPIVYCIYTTVGYRMGHILYIMMSSIFLGLNNIIYDRTCRNEQVS